MDNAALPAAAPPAESTSQKAMLALAGTVLRKLLTVGGTSLATHGLISSNNTETFVSAGLAFAGIAWSFWNDYGRAIVLSQLEVLKAKSLAQAAKLQQHDIAPVTAQQIADQGPAELTAEKVAKVAATLCLLLAFGMLLATPALAQGPIARKIQQDIATKAIGGEPGGNGGLQNILTAFDDKLLPDLQFALNIAEKSGNKTTAACWTVWIDRINARKSANMDADGKPLLPPEPHVITDFQKIMDLRNSLQPDSPFMVACQPIASMIKRDIQQLIGLVIGGGVGLAALVPGL